ncbi:MAG: hypothetical protein LBL86_04250 [Coriobacteriales bacterium]|jgi:hypothetical protein|nr:hypothetical protein [Coriobacteriales bacterium]
MRIVSVKKGYLDICSQDPELLRKTARPCVLVLRLRFRNENADFAVPLRSNIAPNVPKCQYFALPPRPTTKPKHRHGIHYIKMFPITKGLQLRFRTEGNDYYEKIQRIIDENAARIVTACQNYLDDYESNGKPRFATDLDYLLQAMRQTNMVD